jgi:hypothetical protein
MLLLSSEEEEQQNNQGESPAMIMHQEGNITTTAES